MSNIARHPASHSAFSSCLPKAVMLTIMRLYLYDVITKHNTNLSHGYSKYQIREKNRYNDQFQEYI